MITNITSQDGTAYLWAGSDLQYPFYIKEIHFHIADLEMPTIEWQGDLSGPPEGNGIQGAISYSYNQETDQLVGQVCIPPSQQVIRTIQLTHGDAYHYFRNYLGYLESRQITFHQYNNSPIQQFGRGYALYLPEGYDSDPYKDWPLLVFLIGTGERGQSLSLLTRHGPLRTVLDGQALPFIIVSPLLENSPDFRSFPEIYLDGLMNEILTDFRVDP